jgi:hypothetical protein
MLQSFGTKRLFRWIVGEVGVFLILAISVGVYLTWKPHRTIRTIWGGNDVWEFFYTSEGLYLRRYPAYTVENWVVKVSQWRSLNKGTRLVKKSMF